MERGPTSVTPVEKHSPGDLNYLSTLELILALDHALRIAIKSRGFSWHMIDQQQSSILFILVELVYVVHINRDGLRPTVYHHKVVFILLALYKFDLHNQKTMSENNDVIL